MSHFLTLVTLIFLDLSAAPRLEYVNRFPFDRLTIQELIEFNRAYYSHIANHRKVYPDSSALTVIEQECDKLYFAWSALRDAKSESYRVNYRRKALGVLLKIIGPEAFQAGQMPPHVPLWRFTEVRVP